MSQNSILIRADPDAVFDVLDDASAYPRWVVGARRVHTVDSSWPAIGSKFQHALGTAGAELHDSSKVIDRNRPKSIVLEVRFRPTGIARVEIRVAPTHPGSLVMIEETPIDGPITKLPRFVTGSLLTLRNALALQRLRHEVERRVEVAAVA
jgi:uncharacterized protein YndB with AHSA1/START domain